MIINNDDGFIARLLIIADNLFCYYFLRVATCVVHLYNIFFVPGRLSRTGEHTERQSALERFYPGEVE